jgi:hypothetical protein
VRGAVSTHQASAVHCETHCKQNIVAVGENQ